ncbi:MAG: hypothetical protein HZA31_05065 [Opitutae bacterium]|nr:hypothetical protein [Opitutae bacterium]
MAESPFTQTAAPSALDYATIAKSNPQIISGAQWFWWIVGLSCVNTLVQHSGGSVNFVIGLGFTQVADAIFREAKPIAFAIDALALGFFFAMGWYATKGRQWAFITGLVFYSLDALIYVAVQDWMSAAFHGLALYFIIRATKLLRAAIQEARTAAAAPATPVPPPVPEPPVLNN